MKHAMQTGRALSRVFLCFLELAELRDEDVEFGEY